MRSSSPEYDEVVLSDNSDDEDQEDECSEEIPIKIEPQRSREPDVLHKDVVFDDSESDEFSLPQVDWGSLNSQSPTENEVNNCEAPPLALEKDLSGTCLSTEPAMTDHYRELTDSSAMLTATSADESGDRAKVFEGDTSISEGLTFNILSDDHPVAETALLHEETRPVDESPAKSVSRLSRKRCRTSNCESEEQMQLKRLHHADDLATRSGTVAEAVLQRSLQSDAGSNFVSLPLSYDNLMSQSSIESYSVSQSTSSTAETVVTNARGVYPSDYDSSFSQGM